MPLAPGLEKGVGLLKLLVSRGTSVNAAGRCLLWLFLRVPQLASERDVHPALGLVMRGKGAQPDAMHRGWSSRGRSLFPLPLGEVSYLQRTVESTTLEEFCSRHFACTELEDVWVALSVLSLNCAAGYGRAALVKEGSKTQAEALRSLRVSISRVLCRDFSIDRTPLAAGKRAGFEIPELYGGRNTKNAGVTAEASSSSTPTEVTWGVH